MQKHVLVLIAGLMVVFGAILFRSRTKVNDNLKVYAYSSPYSVDPINYDAFIHHITFRSVFSPLLSRYKQGEYEPVVAKSWNSSNKFMTWEFVLRDDLVFQNGKKIDPESVRESLTRIAYLQKKRGSKSGVTEKLRGLASLSGPRQRFEGIKLEGNTLVLNFTEPVPTLLELISFGIYSVVDPSDFDEQGIWKDPHSINAPGPYKIGKWSENSMKLELRREYPAGLRHARAFPTVTIQWDQAFREQADIIVGISKEMVPKSKKFFGAVENHMAFVRCISFRIQSSVCYDLEDRKAMREYFYSRLSKAGFAPTLSFLPLHQLKGVKEGKLMGPENVRLKSKSVIRHQPFRFPHATFFHATNLAVEAMAKDLGLSLEVVETAASTWMSQFDGDKKSYLFDLFTTLTGILIEEPVNDLRFMFTSGEGVRFPDLTGEINQELQKKSPDLSKINDLIWDQAIIWPITHFSVGLWVEESKVDMSHLNWLLPPTSFEWIGQKL